MVSRRIDDLVRECQVFAGASCFAQDGCAYRQLVRQFVLHLPEPHQPFERVVVGSLLLKVARRWVQQMHQRYHAEYPAACAFDPDGRVPREWDEVDRSPIRLFGEWAETFLDEFERTHALPPAASAKQLINRQYSTPLNEPWLAKAVGCHPIRLRALFRQQFGISIRDYQTQCRILQATHLLATSDLKVNAVAQTVGFRSRKNFYAAFHRIVQARPSVVRSWSASDLHRFEQCVKPAGTLLDRASSPPQRSEDSEERE